MTLATRQRAPRGPDGRTSPLFVCLDCGTMTRFDKFEINNRTIRPRCPECGYTSFAKAPRRKKP